MTGFGINLSCKIRKKYRIWVRAGRRERGSAREKIERAIERGEEGERVGRL